MSVYELLTEKDKKLILKYIQCFGPITPNGCVPYEGDIEVVLQEWAKQKNQNLEKLFGGNLILNRPYTYSIANDSVIKEIEEAINNDDKYIYGKMKHWVWRHIGNYNWNTEFGKQIYDIYSSIFSPLVLANNAYDGDNIKLTFEDGESFKIPRGMKPMKILHKLVEKFGDTEIEQDYENFRNWHSQLLNQIHLDGVLTLSIHPLDYMTMSDNGGSWSSCMHWQGSDEDDEPGDYRMGTIECMNSPYIIVAYLHNPKRKMTLPDWVTNSSCDEDEWEWNKKKWRELFIVQDGIITEIKGYPFQDENLTNTALMWIKELAQENLGWEYEDIEVNAKNPVERENKVYYVNPRPTDYMYNDFGSLNLHRARVNLSVLYEHAFKHDPGFFLTEYFNPSDHAENILIDIPYGGKATCMCCGEYIPYQDNKNNSVLCGKCESSKICPCCGEYYDGDGFMVSAYDEPICYGCLDYECSIDQISECSEINSSLIDLYFCVGIDEKGKPIFYDNTVTTLSPDYYSYDYERLFNQIPKYDGDGWGGKYYVTIDMVKDMDWFEDLFDLDDTFDDFLVSHGLKSIDESSD